MSATKQLILGTDQNAYLAPVQGWKQTVATLESRTETFKGHVDKPGGTYWDGQFAEAAQSNAGDGLKTVGSIRDTVDALTDEVTSTVTYSVLPPLSAAKAIINHAETQQGVKVNDDLSMTYTPPPGVSTEDIEKSRRAVATMAKELKDNADKWWAATQTVKTQIEAAEKTISGELNLAAATFNVNNAVEQSRPADVPATTRDGNFYKNWYPASDAPGATQAASAPPAAADPNAPKLGPPSPEGKPFQADPRAGSLTGNLGALGVTDPKSPLEQQPRPTDPRTTLAPKLDPSTPQGKAAIDTMRKYLQNTVPADQVETKLADAINSAQQDRPMYAAPEGDPTKQPPPGFAEGFGDGWNSFFDQMHKLTGQEGTDQFLESWKGLGQGVGTELFERTTNPIGAFADDARSTKDFIDSPYAAYNLGHLAGESAPGLAAAPFGGEAAAIRAGLPAELLTEGGAPRALLQDWNSTGGMPWKDFETQFGTPETRVYPRNDGFPPDYTPQPAQLPAGTIIDRFGHEGGRYLAPDGAPFSDRSLAPESVGSEYHRYMVTGKPLPPGLQIMEGPVEPFYGQTPSPEATQYMIVGPDGVKVSVKELVDRGILDEYGPPLGR